MKYLVMFSAFCCVALTTSICSAAFVFRIADGTQFAAASPTASPYAVTGVAGSSGSFVIQVQQDGGIAPTGTRDFWLTSLSVNYTGGNNNSNISSNPGVDAGASSLIIFTSQANSITVNANGNWRNVAVVNYAILGSAVNGDTDLFRVVLSGQSENNGGGDLTSFSGVFTSNFGQITAVPEPTSMALVGLVAVGAGAYRRFRRKPAAK